jgi:HPt (histidine-containing phosphotransfer) domain-containing protein
MFNSKTSARSEGHLDEAILEELKALLEDDFPDLIETFLLDGQQRVDELIATVNSGVAEDIRQSAHSFKGSTLNVGASHLSQLCRELEDLARSGSTQGSKSLLDRIENEFSQVDRLMRQRFL